VTVMHFSVSLQARSAGVMLHAVAPCDLNPNRAGKFSLLIEPPQARSLSLSYFSALGLGRSALASTGDFTFCLAHKGCGMH